MATQALMKRHVQHIEDFLVAKNLKYKFHTRFVEKTGDFLHYETTFSLPTKTKPVPTAIVLVHWYLKDKPGKQIAMEWSFEHDLLRNTNGKSIRDNQFESWIDRILENKLLTRNMLDLRTKFENTRIHEDVSNFDEFSDLDSEDMFYDEKVHELKREL